MNSKISFKVTNSELDLSKHNARHQNFEEHFYASKSAQSSLTFLDPHVLKDSEDHCDVRKDATKEDFYYFLPSLKALLTPLKNEETTFVNGCFANNVASLIKFSKEETIISITSSKPTSTFCKDSYWLSTSGIHDIKFAVLHGEHKITWKNLSDDDMAEIKVNGIRIFSFCQGMFTSLDSLFNSLKLYIGGLGKNPDSWIPIMRPSVPAYMEKANIDFLSRFANWNLTSRNEAGQSILDIDESEIKTGDFIAIYRLDGLDPLIMFGSGSHLGHSAVAVWVDGVLNVFESQDGWYWPKRGIQRNTWKQWVQWAHAADFNVAILPIRDEIRQNFNVTAAIEWFESGIEGLNYGYHNFLFSWLDTARENLPNVVDTEVLLSVFSILEKITKPTADTILSQALNMRLSTKNLTIPQATAEAARRNMTFEEMLAMPEIEGWAYTDGKNYVCSCFVIAFWRALGVFGNIDIIPTEFTPKDIYQLNIFDQSYKDKRPQSCKDADPELEYCQVIGKYQVQLTGYNTITPYAHMNEKCPSIAPDYIRREGC